VLIDVLADLIPSFEGQAGRVRCFDHIVNIVAKATLQLFDGGKEIEYDTEEGRVERDVGDDEDLEEPDSVEGMESVESMMMSMSEVKRNALYEETEPIKHVLVKVGAK
jgi:hypothetical protein